MTQSCPSSDPAMWLTTSTTTNCEIDHKGAEGRDGDTLLDQMGDVQTPD